VSDQTARNVLARHGIPPAPERKKTTTWKEFIMTHMDVLAATDFFTTEVWTKAGLVTYYVLFFIHVASRRVHIAGLTPYPDTAWVTPSGLSRIEACSYEGLRAGVLLPACAGGRRRWPARMHCQGSIPACAGEP
jgi:hypothetical protein